MIQTIDKVSDKHSAFVSFLLLNGLNATKAYQSAYPDCSYDTARTNGSMLLANTNIKAEISRQQAEMIKITGYSKQQAHQDLMDDRQLARDQKQPSAAISADSQLIRLYGMDQVAGSESDEQRILDEVKSIQARKIAEQIVLNANKPKHIESKEIKNEV